MPATEVHKLLDGDSVVEQFLSCTKLPVTSTGLDIYNSVTATLEENKLCWGNCISVCIDGAPAMTGRTEGFISRLKQDFPNVGSTHCFFTPRSFGS
jgi:hypothetical protein